MPIKVKLVGGSSDLGVCVCSDAAKTSKVKLVDNSSEVGVGVGSNATVKLIKEALKRETEERTEADVYLQKEIDGILSSSACYLLINENKNGSIDVSILDKKEEVLDTKTITLTEKLIKNVKLDYDAGQLVFTHFDGTVSTCGINTIKKAIVDETSRATTRENEIEANLNAEIERSEVAEEALGQSVEAERERAERAEIKISANLTNEIARAKGVENTLNSKIDDESSRAIAAEKALQNNIGAEESARIAGDSDLNARINTLETDIDARIDSIEEKIPSQASAQNQLADKGFVNSSIATNTATFRGTYNIVTDFGLSINATEAQIVAAIADKMVSESIIPTNNDYVFVAFPDATVSTQFTKFDRYKYIASNAVWTFEYELNNSSFTADQWAAINSGVTNQLLESLKSNKLDKVTSAQPNNKTRLYAINADGSQGTAVLDENSTAALTIPLRTNNGNIKVPLTPVQNYDAVSKDYVDNYSGKIDSVSLDGTALTIDANKNVDIPVSLTTTAGSEAIAVNSDSLNVVTRNTNQTISGVKTFKYRPIFDDGASFYGSDQAPLSVAFSSGENAVDFSIMASDIHYWLNVEDPETDNMRYTVSLPAKDGVLAVQGKSVIEKVNSLAAVPNEELGLFRYAENIDGIATSSHIYENVKEDHAAEEKAFNKTTTKNGTQLSNAAAFMGQFDSTLSNFVSISSLTNVYCFYYNNDVVSRNGIRIGTKSTGRLTLTCTKDGSITFGKYFSYNGSTQVVAYDTNSAVIVDGTKYEFAGSDEGTITIDITAGEHTITSNGPDIGGGSDKGRIVLISFGFEVEPYSVYSKHALARVEEVKEEVQAVDAKLGQHKTESNARFTEVEKSVSKNADGIADINARMGDIQFFQIANRLPNPAQRHLNKVYRLGDKFYQCVQKGDGELKEITFDAVAGTSEVAVSNVNGLIADLNKEDFSTYYHLDDSGAGWSKLFRNNGDIRLGSSGATGYIAFYLQNHYIYNLPCTKLKIGFKAYNAKGSSVRIEIGNPPSEFVLTQFIDSADTETLVDLSGHLGAVSPIHAIDIATEDTHNVENNPVYNDKRVIITRLIAEFGTVEYEWQEIGARTEIVDLTTIA